MSDRTVVLELAGEHKLARDLVAGGVYVPGYAIPINEDCELLLRGLTQEMRLPARVVFVNDEGIGLQLLDCDSDLKQRIADLAAGHSTIASPGFAGRSGETIDEAVTEAQRALPAMDDATEQDATTTDVIAAPSVGDETIEDGTIDPGEDDATQADNKKVASNVHERMRGLTLAQQLKIAHHGEVSERIVLERMYGKNVWEALLRNPRLTGPEVARIARMGSLPRTLVEIIVGNGAWLQIPEVRRALLTNPRLGTDQAMRVLRLLPKHELKIAAMQTVYPMSVRDIAKRILKEAGG